MVPLNYDEYEEMVTRGRAEFALAVAGQADRWVPASGGTEVPFHARGGVFLYVYNPRTGQHAYLDCRTDMIVADYESMRTVA